MITITDLHAGYGDRAVLRGVGLAVAPGELVALCGPNGCGKTTLLRVLTGVIDASAGTVLIDGAPVARMPAAALARTVAVVAQNADVPPGFTAFEIALMGRTPHLRLLQSEGRRDVEIVRRAMLRTDTWALRDRPVHELSGGERQRVLVARALAQEPRVLLLDEPTSHLDLQHQVDAFRLINGLCREDGLAAVAVVHDLTLAAAFADRIVLLAGGRIAAEGTPGAVLQPDVIERVYAVRVRVLPHPATGRPIVVPEIAAPASREASEAAS